VQVRVIEYCLEGVAGAEPIYRLVTTILDPDQAPAEELAALYHERWEIETALAELKTHLRGAKIVLRSKTPDLVRQEFYAFIMAHFAIRGLMHEAGEHDVQGGGKGRVVTAPTARSGLVPGSSLDYPGTAGACPRRTMRPVILDAAI
jgi:hypothetical protein